MLLQRAMHNSKCVHNVKFKICRIKWDLPCVGLVHTKMSRTLGLKQ